MTDRGKETRARLIEATRSVVRKAGYAHASTRAIADAAGVAEGTIYRHFPDKTALFFAAALESNAAVVDWVAKLPGRAGQATVEANLADLLVRLAELEEQIVPLELAILADPELMAQRQQALAATGGRPVGPPEAIAAYLRAEQRLGRVRSDVDPEKATIVILAALFGLAVTPWPRETGRDHSGIGAAVRLFVQGIEPRAADR
jgi:AcrR family transcriptional regulator